MQPNDLVHLCPTKEQTQHLPVSQVHMLRGPDRTMEHMLDNISMSSSFAYCAANRNEVFASIIIPVYNTKEHLERCLKSILAQTLPDFEVICIDDGSTDGSSDVLSLYAANDNRIRILHQENAGPSKARNYGLSEARGKYVWLVDSDDAIVENALELLQKEIVSRDHPDVIIFSYELDPPFDSETPRWLTEARVTRNATYPTFTPEVLFSESGATPFMWRYFLRTDFLRAQNLWFWEDLCLGEDLHFQFISLPLAHNIVFLDKPLYLYRPSRSDSLMSHFNADLILKAQCHLEIIELIVRNWKEHGILDHMRAPLTTWAIDFFYQQVVQLAPNDRDVLLLAFVNQLQSWAEISPQCLDSCSLERLYEIFGNASCNSALSAPQDCRWLYASSFAIRHWGNLREGMDELLQSPLSSIVKSQVKTVAIYYHRLFKGGAERVTQMLVPLWKSMGYEVVVIVDEGGLDGLSLMPEKDKVFSIPIIHDEDKLSCSPRAHALATILQRQNVDVLVYHAWNSGWLPWDLVTAKMCNCAFAILCNNVFSIREISADPYFALQPYTYAPAEAVACLSEADRAFWSNFNGNTHKIVNPLDPQLFAAHTTELAGNTLIWIGRFSEEKRPEDALFILRKVQERVPDARLMMLGSGEDEDHDLALKNLADNLGLSDSVDFCGFVENVSDYLERSDLLLVTSEYEGFHLGLFEALSHGVPAVMYQLPNLSWVEGTEGVTKVLHASIDEAAEAIVNLMNNRDLLARASNAARAHALSFESINIGQQWSVLFNSLKQRRNPPSIDRETALMWEVLFDGYKYGINKLNGRHSEEMTRISRQLDNERMRFESERLHFESEQAILINSLSFRIGRAVTLIPRKTRTAWRVLQSQGMRGILRVCREKLQQDSND